MGCIVVIAGFLVGSEGEIRFSWLGVFFGVLSSAFVAGNGVLIKNTLTYLQNNEWKSISYNTFLATLLMMPLLLFSGVTNPNLSVLLPPSSSSQLRAFSISGELVGVVDTVAILQIRPPVALDVADEVQPLGDSSASLSTEPASSRMIFFFWVSMLLASMLGFLINVSVILLVKYTSPLTSVIVGTTKVPNVFCWVATLFSHT